MKILDSFRYENKRNGFDLVKTMVKCYQKIFSRRSDTLHNANASGTVTFILYNSKNTLLKNNFIIAF